MQKIQILDNRDKPDSFCPMCGAKSLVFNNETSKINECEHLIYVGSDEGPEFDKEKLYSKIEDSEDSTEEALSKLLNNDYTCFTLSMSAPAGISGYIIYKFDKN
jgi:hypothetical protein